MAKLLTEYIVDIDILKEDVEIDGEKKKEYYLKGPFLEADVLNLNGRKYMIDTITREVKKFNETKISKNRSVGELDHPPDPTVNLDRVSHIITELKMVDNVGYGIAKILDTPMGKIIKKLIDGGVSLGMSTRGVGSLDGEFVKDDYSLITIDAVCQPSAPSAYVEGVLENKEYIIGENGEIVEKAIEILQKRVDTKSNKYDRKDVSKLTLQYMLEFIDTIKAKTI